MFYLFFSSSVVIDLLADVAVDIYFILRQEWDFV